MSRLGWVIAGGAIVAWFVARREARYWQGEADAADAADIERYADVPSDAFAPLDLVTRVVPYTVTSGSTTSVPWYLASCGHAHPWGTACSVWTP